VTPPLPTGCVRATLPWHKPMQYVREVASTVGLSRAARESGTERASHPEGIYQQRPEVYIGTSPHDLTGKDFDINEMDDVAFNAAFAPPDPDAVAVDAALAKEKKKKGKR
jgi:hypothetical protein